MAVSLCLASNFPISIIWGPRCTQSTMMVTCRSAPPNTAFAGTGLQRVLVFNPACDRRGARAGQATFLVNERMFLDRNGYLEETFFTSFSPIRDETGKVAGLYHPSSR